MKNPVTVVTTAPENEHLSRVEDAWKTGLHGLSSSADQFCRSALERSIYCEGVSSTLINYISYNYYDSLMVEADSGNSSSAFGATPPRGDGQIVITG